MNTTNARETGSIRFYSNDGNALFVRMTGISSSYSQFTYSIPPNGCLGLYTDGSPADMNVGWAQLLPDTGAFAPAGSAFLGSIQRGVNVAEAGFPAVDSTTHARLYVDLSGGHSTGIAVNNPSRSPIHINAAAYQTDGAILAGNGPGSIDLSAKEHDARFVNQLITGLPSGFVGVLDLSSTSPFAAMTIRSLTNSANDFIFTAFPVADFNLYPPAALAFPQVADGGGYQTQVILLNTGGTNSSITVRYLNDDGQPLAIGRDYEPVQDGQRASR
jgi:hypothetical protein